ncbi:MAG: hypothetical protein MHPSP_000110 [Paramarteilia canceri]
MSQQPIFYHSFSLENQIYKGFDVFEENDGDSEKNMLESNTSGTIKMSTNLIFCNGIGIVKFSVSSLDQKMIFRASDSRNIKYYLLKNNKYLAIFEDGNTNEIPLKVTVLDINLSFMNSKTENIQNKSSSDEKPILSNIIPFISSFKLGYFNLVAADISTETKIKSEKLMALILENNINENEVSPAYKLEVWQWELKRCLLSLELTTKSENSKPRHVIFASKTEIYVVGDNYFKYISFENMEVKHESNIKASKFVYKKIIKLKDGKTLALTNDNKLMVIEKSRIETEIKEFSPG